VERTVTELEEVHTPEKIKFTDIYMNSREYIWFLFFIRSPIPDYDVFGLCDPSQSIPPLLYSFNHLLPFIFLRCTGKMGQTHVVRVIINEYEKIGGRIKDKYQEYKLIIVEGVV